MRQSYTSIQTPYEHIHTKCSNTQNNTTHTHICKHTHITQTQEHNTDTYPNNIKQHTQIIQKDRKTTKYTHIHNMS